MSKPVEIKKLNIEELFSFIERHNVSIPEFQRGYVWKKKQVRALFDSLMKRYPVGSFVIWKTTQKIGQRNLFTKEAEGREKYLVLDGQQRLLTLYYLCNQQKFLGVKDFFQEVYEGTEKKPIEFEHFYFHDIRRPELQYSENKQSEFDRGNFTKRLGKDYLFPVILVSIDDYLRAIQIFERINQAGTPISTESIFLSETWNKKTNLSHILRKWRQKESGGLSARLGSIVFIHALSFVIQLEKFIGEDSSFRVNIKLETLKKIADKIREEKKRVFESRFRDILRAVSRAMSFLRKEFDIQAINELPSQTMVTVLSIFFYYRSEPSKRQRKELKKWFWRSSLGSRYIGSGYNENIAVDVEKMRDFAGGRIRRLNIPAADLKIDEFIAANIKTGRSTIKNSMKLMLWRQDPAWLNGETISRGEVELKTKRKEDDHFYAYDLFRKGHLSKNDSIDSILNLCFLPKDENIRKRTEIPSVWLEKRKKELGSVSKEDEKSFFKTHLLPFKSIQQLKEFERHVLTVRHKIKNQELKKSYAKFFKRRFNIIEKAFSSLQRGN